MRDWEAVQRTEGGKVRGYEGAKSRSEYAGKLGGWNAEGKV